MVFAKTGPFWYRGFFKKLSSDEVKSILASYGGERVVVGHTIVDDISTLQDGMVYAIDVKHSEKVKNAQYNAMVMENGSFFKVNYQGKREPIDASRKPSNNGGSAIILKAIKEENLAVVKTFIKEGFKINNTYSSEKYQLLHFAIEHGNLDIVSFLLKQGADPNLFQDGKTALMYAVKHKNTEAILLLLSNKSVDVNKTNHRQQTALFYAAKYGTQDIAKLLLEAGAKWDVVDQAGLTPFQYAVKKQNVPVAKFLKATEGKSN